MFEKDLKQDNSVKKKYYTGGLWRSSEVGRKRSFTTSKVARIYIAVPPADGWPGGDPEKNGYKVTGRK